MFGFLRKRETGSAYRLDGEQERRLRKMERDIARLKEGIELFTQHSILEKEELLKTLEETEDGTPEPYASEN